MSSRYGIAFVILLSAVLTHPTKANAKRILPRAQYATTATTQTSSQKNISTSVSFRSDRNAIVATFSNLENAQSVSYQFSYMTDGVKQGVSGTITDMTPDPATRELLFGTCSNNVCTYNTNITDAKLVITTTLKNGTKIIKPYKLLR